MAWQGPPSDGAKGKDAKSKEKERLDSGKGPTHNSAVTKSVIKAGDNIGETYDGD